MSSRKRRSDYGTIQTTDRDIALLTWTAEQYAVRFDQLHQLVNRYKGSEVTESNIKALVNRWRKADWVKKRKIVYGEPAWIWVSKEGLQAMDLPYPQWEPKPGRMAHIHAVNAVRLFVEGRPEVDSHWISERQIHLERRAADRKHKVDGEVNYQGNLVAIEVELTQKSAYRLQSVLRELSQSYPAVWYFLADDCYAPVADAIHAFPGSKQQFVVYKLNQIF